MTAQAERLPRRRDRAGRRPKSSRATAYKPRGIKLARDVKRRPPTRICGHRRSSSLRKIRPAFGGVQTGGNSSAIVDGAAAALVGCGGLCRRSTARRRSRASSPARRVGVPPEIMGIGPVPAIQAVLRARRPAARRHRPLRDQRGVRRAGDGLRPRARPRRGQAQRQRRRDRHRPSARRDRHAPAADAGARIASAPACAMASPPPASAAARASRC